MNVSEIVTLVLLRAYSFVSNTGILRSPSARRAFARAYFLYKRYVEDPYAGLVRVHPELFKGGHIIDVGANLGYTAMIFTAAADLQSKVYAFEPDPDNFAALDDLIKRSGLQHKVVPIQAAVGENDGEVELWRNPSSHADRRIWTDNLRGTTSARLAAVITVPQIRLDRFLAGLDMPACFVKIDVQGYELPVCLGLLQTMESSPDLRIAFEYDPVMIASHGFEPRALLELFWSRRFFLYVIDPRGNLETLPRGEFGFAAPERGLYWELLASRQELIPAAAL
jgi:FkbM family methyltransferase